YQAQKIMYTTPGLPYGTHSLTIEAAYQKNPASSGFWVWVDAFEAAGGNASYTRLEQTTSSAVYSGSWVNVNLAINSGGSALQAMDQGSRVTFTFNGTSA